MEIGSLDLNDDFIVDYNAHINAEAEIFHISWNRNN